MDQLKGLGRVMYSHIFLEAHLRMFDTYYAHSFIHFCDWLESENPLEADEYALHV